MKTPGVGDTVRLVGELGPTFESIVERHGNAWVITAVNELDGSPPWCDLDHVDESIPYGHMAAFFDNIDKNIADA